MNAIDFLIKEHQKVRKMLADINDHSHRDETRRKRFDLLCDELLEHEETEHKKWYPYFKNDERLNRTVKHLVSEENAAEKAIRQFDNVKTQEEWEEKFLKFKRDVEHHAYEEEHDLFPEVRKLLSEEELDKIGKEMYEFKKCHRKMH